MNRHFYIFLLLLAALMVPVTASATDRVRGDVDGNGVVGMDDLTALINYLVYGNGINMTGADVDLSGGVGMDDLTTLINYLVYGAWPSDDSHEWVDLGLPSGTLWATCNVGADSPEDYGDYFAWGETQPKDVYNWSTYMWCNGDNFTLTKYCNDSSHGNNGFVDNKTELDPEDDAATANWGQEWRMPSLAQIQELLNNCTTQWTTINGVNGRLLTSTINDESFFLPANGYLDGSTLESNGWGNYWSRTLDPSFPGEAYYLNFGSSLVRTYSLGRQYGFSVRAVRVPQN